MPQPTVKEIEPSPAHSHRFALPKFLSQSGQKPNRSARIQFVVVGGLLALLCVNAIVAAMTTGRIYPGVSVAGHDLSFQTRLEAKQTLEKSQTQRHFTLKVGEKSFSATDTDIGAQYNLITTVNSAYNVGRNTFAALPLVGILASQKNGQLGYAYNLDLPKLKAFTSAVVDSVGHDPVDATLVINEGVIQTQPDQDGLRIDQKTLNQIIETSLSDAQDQNISLSPQVEKADIQVSDLGTARDQAEALLAKQVTLTYNGRNFVADKNALGHIVVFEAQVGSDGKKHLVAKVSPQQVAGYVQSVANQINITPKNKKISVANGTSTVTQDGVDGLAVNQDPAISAIVAGLSAGNNVNVTLTASPVAFKTETNQFGGQGGLNYSSYIEISLSSQHLWAWQDGQVVFSSPVTTGATGAGFPTITGLFSIYAKERDRYLNGHPYGYDYNVFVQYWMPFSGGYGLHDASWRSSFGGSDYYWGGSHGCVNMPLGSAAFIYGWAPIGTPVWVHS
jgi:lipoprotein-anchoring transpeptidase ErfK/SrfK